MKHLIKNTSNFLLIIISLAGHGMAQPNDVINQELISAAQLGSFEKIDSLLSKGADPNYKDEIDKSAIQYLDLWLSGWGDGGFMHQAKIAELLLKHGAKLDPEMIEVPLRVLDEARNKNHLSTLLYLEVPLRIAILDRASDTSKVDTSHCKRIEKRALSNGDATAIIGCKVLYDGTPFTKGNKTIFWGSSKRIKANGKIGAWGREGRWIFYDQSRAIIGFADYYRGTIQSKNGVIY